MVWMLFVYFVSFASLSDLSDDLDNVIKTSDCNINYEVTNDQMEIYLESDNKQAFLNLVEINQEIIAYRNKKNDKVWKLLWIKDFYDPRTIEELRIDYKRRLLVFEAYQKLLFIEFSKDSLVCRF